MKKFIIIFLSSLLIFHTLFVFLPSTNHVKAESDDQTAIIESISCGTYSNACCIRKSNRTINAKAPNLHLPFPLNILNGLVSGVWNIFGRPLINGLFSGVNNLIFDTILGAPIQENQTFCVEGDPQSLNGNCICLEKEVQNLNKLCEPILSSTEQKQCFNCVRDANGIWTGVGCLYTDLGKLVRERITGTFVGIAGSMAFLCIMYAAFILQTSRGNPERIKKAKELLRACITGLLLIIFSIFILRLIGVNILRIPGFS